MINNERPAVNEYAVCLVNKSKEQNWRHGLRFSLRKGHWGQHGTGMYLKIIIQEIDAFDRRHTFDFNMVP